MWACESAVAEGGLRVRHEMGICAAAALAYVGGEEEHGNAVIELLSKARLRVCYFGCAVLRM